MTDSIQKPQHPCRAKLNCRYKVGSYCTYGEIVGAIFSVIHDEAHKGSHCIVDLADTFDLPYIDLDEDGRQRGIGNLFADMGVIH